MCSKRLSIPPFVMAMLPVGNPRNEHDPGNTQEPNTYGSVGYTYSIGKHEVTNAQYVQFLNAVAAEDRTNLYSPRMGIEVQSGITRTGSPGSYRYQEKTLMGNKPVNNVNWFDALRFCNWLHNGRPRGAQDTTTTERGAYTLTGAMIIGVGTDPIHGANGRNAGVCAPE